MLTVENIARRFQSEELDDLFDLLADKKRGNHQYAWRYKKNVKFYSIHQTDKKNVIMSAVSGPASEDIRFSIARDGSGYAFEMSVGDFTEQNIETINRALKGLASRLVKREKSGGFDKSKWRGFYLSAVWPSDDVLPVYQEAVDLGLMSEEFRDLCLEWGFSIQKLPKT